MALLFYRDGLRLSNVKILITFAYREGCVRPEDLGEEDIVGLVLIYMNRDKPHFSLPDKRRFGFKTVALRLLL